MPMRCKSPRSALFRFAWLLGAALCVAACQDSGGPVGLRIPPDARREISTNLPTYELYADASGVEYEPDTGALACPKVLMSNVGYYVNIRNVGAIGFTFYAPHTRLAYLGKSRYRYRMTYGRSDGGDWAAEGPWTGKCYGISKIGGGWVDGFEGTVWRLDSGGGGDCAEETDVDWSSSDPSACGGGGSGGGGGAGSPGSTDPGGTTGDPGSTGKTYYFVCEVTEWSDGSEYWYCTPTAD